MADSKMTDADLASLIEWSNKFGHAPSFTEFSSLKKLVTPQSKAIWRHLTTHLAPKDEAEIKRKQYLLHVLKHQSGHRENINVKLKSGSELTEHIKRQELKLKIESLKSRIQDKRETLAGLVQKTEEKFVKELEEKKELKEDLKKLSIIRKKNEMLKEEIKHVQECEEIVQNFLKSPVSYEDAQKDIRVLTNEIDVSMAMRNFDLTSIANSPFNITNRVAQISPSGVHLQVLTDLLRAHLDASLPFLCSKKNRQGKNKSFENKLFKIEKFHLRKEIELGQARKRRLQVEDEYNQVFQETFQFFLERFQNEVEPNELEDLLQSAGETVSSEETSLKFESMASQWGPDKDVLAKFEFLSNRLNNMFESIAEKQKIIKMYMTTNLYQSLLQFQEKSKDFANSFDHLLPPDPLFEEVLMFVKTPLLPPVQPQAELSDYHWELLVKALKRKLPNLNFKPLLKKPQTELPTPSQLNSSELNTEVALLQADYDMSSELLQFWIHQPFNQLFKEEYDNFKNLLENREKALMISKKLSRALSVDEDDD